MKRKSFRWFAFDTRGNVAIMFAVGLPVLVASGLGGMELVSVVGDRQSMQATAEAAALAGAKQLGVDATSATAERATEFAKAGLQDLAPTWTFNVSSTLTANGRGVEVSINGHRDSLFHNFVPPGGWNAGVKATAEIAGETPLCILAFDSAGGSVLGLQKSAVITAPNCGIQSNDDITANGSSSITAGSTKAVGTATGTISPAAFVGAPAVNDPFASMTIDVPKACDDTDLKVDNTTVDLPPGVHCGKIHMQHGAALHLLPGEHYFSGGSLILQQDAELTGSDVVLIFDDTQKMKFQQNSSIRLQGRETGPFAGFVLAATRANSSDFELSTDHAQELLGTVYIPNGTLTVSGTNNSIADKSAWTVIVAKNLQLSGSPQLVVNSDYAASTLPVPAGVGDARVALRK